MRRAFAIAVTAVFFGLLGPAIGGLIVIVPRGDIEPTMFGLAYIFGAIPALVAGAVYGNIRVRLSEPWLRWYLRPLWGAVAALGGLVVLAVIVVVFDVLTAGGSVVSADVTFLKSATIAGLPAGMICALFLGSAAPKRVAPAQTEAAPGGASEEWR